MTRLTLSSKSLRISRHTDIKRELPDSIMLFSNLFKMILKLGIFLHCIVLFRMSHKLHIIGSIVLNFKSEIKAFIFSYPTIKNQFFFPQEQRKSFKVGRKVTQILLLINLQPHITRGVDYSSFMQKKQAAASSELYRILQAKRQASSTFPK